MSAASARRIRVHDHVRWVDPVPFLQNCRSCAAARTASHQSSIGSSVSPDTVSAFGSSSPARRRCSITSGNAARQKHLYRRIIARPVRQRIHQTRHLAVHGGPVLPPWAAATRPHARSPAGAESDSSIRQTPHAPPSHSAARPRSEYRACEARRSPTPAPRVPTACAMSSQIGCPEGASAECGSDIPSASANYLRGRRGPKKLAPSARRSARPAAHVRGVLERNLMMRESRADRLAGPRLRPPPAAASRRPAPAHTANRASPPAPSSSPADPYRRSPRPITPLSRWQRPDQPAEHDRRIVAIRQAVEHPRRPCVRPSQGSVQYPANGTASALFNSCAAASTSRPTSQ